MKFLLSILIILISTLSFSQVLENPGFEEWEDSTGPNEEPVNWSSIQTGTPDNLAGVAPQVMFKSTDAHTGDFSIRLKNTSAFSIIANGVITNGRVLLDFVPSQANIHTVIDNPDWNTVCETRPDSMIGYYKYSPIETDITVIRTILHTGEGAIPDADSSTWVGMAVFNSPNEEITEWTRFSAPFTYFNEDNPEYILFNISAGNGLDAIAGSEGWYDDLELVYNPVGINEDLANKLLHVYSYDHNVVVNLSKFGAGEIFDIEIYSNSGQLVVKDTIISGGIKEWNLNTSGVFICKLQSKDGLLLTKKIVVQ
jgi:hypothetical protein